MTDNQAYYPWRRFWARMLDMSIYETLWMVVLGLGLHVNLTTRDGFASLLDVFVSVGMMLLVEPFLLHYLGTTPGKAIFGLHLRAEEGRKLTLAEARTRTWGVVGAGLGFAIPIYNLIRLWKSYKLCQENVCQPWDDGLSYTLRDTKGYRWVAFVAAHIVIFFAIYVTISFQTLPPNRGDLTVAQFAQNYNYYADYYGMNATNSYLDETGSWVQKPADGTVYFDAFNTVKPTFAYTQKDGYLTGVTLAVTLQNSKELIPSYNSYMLLSALAFAGAQPEVGLFSDLPKAISDRITVGEFDDHSFARAGVAFVVDTEHRGYEVTHDFLFPQEGAKELFFGLHFSMTKQ